MKPRRKPVVGETLYSLNVGNAARYSEKKLTPKVVTKVGRKFFTLGDGWEQTQFHLETWQEKTEYSPTEAIYESPQAWEDEKEEGHLCETINKAFEYRRNVLGLSLQQLRRIAEILNEEQPSK